MAAEKGKRPTSEASVDASDASEELGELVCPRLSGVRLLVIKLFQVWHHVE